jgi:hypothetical protein
MVILCSEIGCDETDHIALLGPRLQAENDRSQEKGGGATTLPPPG